MPDFRTLDAGEVRLRAAVAGEGPLVILVHGFPESWRSWRHQIGPVAGAGFTACAIDVRGYGGSDKPHPVEAYAMERMIADLVGVADALQPQAPAILVGHDWGAPIVWNSALVRPDRFRAVAALSVPFMGVPKQPFTEVFDAVFTRKNRFFYQAYFQKEGVAEAELEADPRGFLRRFYYAISGDAPDGSWPKKAADATLLEGLIDPDPFPAWLPPEELDYYVAEFERSGFRGPLNRYRNHERDFEFLQAFKHRHIEQPALFVSGTRDMAFNMAGAADPIATMRRHVPNLGNAVLLEGCGHWTQQERPEEVNALLIPWLESLV
ncbi:MAG: alpha/beta fold hydrolase [Phenylobacterium sp.]|uniref:alpha/beta fold hydrolase n=1 Tax=Phenylobacterium sp. TaxID=1871053 RepID=UPI00391C924D